MGGVLRRARARSASIAPRRRHGILPLVMLVAAASVAQAQEGVVAGKVIAAGSRAALAEAEVTTVGPEGPTLHATTGPTGRFRFGAFVGTAPTLRLRVTRVGYQPAVSTVQVGDTNVVIALSEAAVQLDAVVVTGTPGETQKRALGNSISTIDAPAVNDVTSVPDVQTLINGRAPGVVVAPGTGLVGSGSRIRIRGLSSLSLSAEPLLYVDGVRVDNEQASGPAVQGITSVISRINDYRPEDIESVEIVKGPAAAALYGTEAAAGVINIITKKGRPGAPKVDLVVKAGANWFMNPEGRLPVNYSVDDAGVLHSLDYNGLVAANGGVPLFGRGDLEEGTASISGGSPAVQYYISGDVTRQLGVEPNNDLKRWSGRGNFTIVPTSKLQITTSLAYSKGKNNLSLEGAGGGVLFSSIFSSPAKLDTESKGFGEAYPAAYYNGEFNSQDVEKFTGSIQFQYQPTSWLVNRLTLGTDITHEDNETLIPKQGDTYAFLYGDFITGFRELGLRDAHSTSLDVSTTASLHVGPNLLARTSVGGQYHRLQVRSSFLDAFGFPAPNITAISGAAFTQAFEGTDENKELGIYAQEGFEYKNRLFFTAALRGDANSSFGANVDYTLYPKFSASWVLRDGQPGFIRTFRLRGAYGRSGKQPISFTALQTYSPITGPNDLPAVTPAAPGNPNLRPEVSREFETGFEASLLDDRIGVDLTYYNSRTKDVIIARNLAPSTGFSQQQLVNAGSIKNSGLELLIRGQPIRSHAVTWDLSWNIGTNSNEIVDLGGLLPIVLGNQQQRVGYPIGGVFLPQVVSATFDPTTKSAINVMCAGDTPQAAPTPCYGPSGTVIAPSVFLGRMTPTAEGSLGSTLTLWGKLRLYTLVDYKRGMILQNNNDLVRCEIRGLCDAAIHPENYDPVYVAQVQSGGALKSAFFEPSGFFKLREVSVSYPIGGLFRSAADRALLTVAGRNLHTWTKYKGLDPEATFIGVGGSITQFRFDEQANMPQLAQFVAMLRLSF